ncbi:MAG TPA: hypothetical protein VIT65_03570 [Microlunatus sp.]
MSVTRKAVIGAIAALTLSGSMVASTAPADAHTYTKEGTVSAKEANKLFKQAFKQRCLTVHEARHIAHGSGYENWDDDDHLTLVFTGTTKSRIDSVALSIADDGCTTIVTAYKS